MRVLIVGNRGVRGLETIYLEQLKKIIPSVELFNIVKHVKYGTLITRVRNRLYDRSLFAKANLALKEYVNEFQPTIIWVFKGVEVNSRTIAQFRKDGISLVNYNPDHPFIRTSVAHGGKDIERSVPLYHLHFCYSRMLMEQIERKYGTPCVHLPFGYDVSDMEYQRIMHVTEQEKACFIGTPDKYRLEVVRKLCRLGMPVDVYGDHWRRYLQSERNVTLFPTVIGSDFWTALRKYRVQLNVFRPHNINSHNMRSFEIPAVGGIQLAPESDEHLEFFERDREIFLFRNLDEMAEKAQWLLNLSGSKTDEFRVAARERSVNSGYSYTNRARDVAGCLEQMFGSLQGRKNLVPRSE